MGMKGAFATIALAGVACGALAQGDLLFDNNNSGLVQIQIGDPARAVGESQQNTPFSGVWNVALLYAPGQDTLGLYQVDFTGTAVADYIPNATVNPTTDGDGSFQDTSGG